VGRAQRGDRQVSRALRAAGEDRAASVRQPEIQGRVREDRCAGGDHPVRRPRALHAVRPGHGGAGERVPAAAFRKGETLTPAKKAPLGADLVIPALALGFAVYFFISIADLAWEAKANGVLIGSVLVLLIAIQVARSVGQIARKKADLSLAPLLEPRDALGKRIGLVLLTVAFIAAMPWLGLTLSLFLGMAAGLYLMGVRNRSHLVWIPLAVAACAYLLFIAALNSDFPHGPVENLLALLPGVKSQ
jgi:hypothetical protein